MPGTITRTSSEDSSGGAEGESVVSGKRLLTWSDMSIWGYRDDVVVVLGFEG